MCEFEAISLKLLIVVSLLVLVAAVELLGIRRANRRSSSDEGAWRFGSRSVAGKAAPEAGLP